MLYLCARSLCAGSLCINVLASWGALCAPSWGFSCVSISACGRGVLCEPGSPCAIVSVHQGSQSSGVCAPGPQLQGSQGCFWPHCAAGDLAVRGPCQGLKWVQLCHILAVPAPIEWRIGPHSPQCPAGEPLTHPLLVLSPKGSSAVLALGDTDAEPLGSPDSWRCPPPCQSQDHSPGTGSSLFMPRPPGSPLLPSAVELVSQEHAIECPSPPSP